MKWLFTVPQFSNDTYYFNVKIEKQAESSEQKMALDFVSVSTRAHSFFSRSIFFCLHFEYQPYLTYINISVLSIRLKLVHGIFGEKKVPAPKKKYGKQKYCVIVGMNSLCAKSWVNVRLIINRTWATIIITAKKYAQNKNNNNNSNENEYEKKMHWLRKKREKVRWLPKIKVKISYELCTMLFGQVHVLANYRKIYMHAHCKRTHFNSSTSTPKIA